MDEDFQRLLRMHDLAARFGDGFKPALRNLLLDRLPQETETVRHLNASLKSSGPNHHDLSPAQLEDRGAAIIGTQRHQTHAKDGTDG